MRMIRVSNLMNRAFSMAALGLLAALVPASAAGAAGPAADLYAELEEQPSRFGLAQTMAASFQTGTGSGDMGDPSSDSRVSPFLAGLMSAVVPGSGQLVQGQSRGWLYLGIEAAAWFSYFAIRSAGHQAETDYREFADDHWTLEMYETVTECEGGGPVNFEEELAEIQDLKENAPDDYYESIGRNDVYACGWDGAGSRTDYLSMRDDANDLFRGSRIAGTVAFANHLVSAVDAARSAARARRNRSLQSLEWRVAPAAGGVAVQFALRREF